LIMGRSGWRLLIAPLDNEKRSAKEVKQGADLGRPGVIKVQPIRVVSSASYDSTQGVQGFEVPKFEGGRKPLWGRGGYLRRRSPPAPRKGNTKPPTPHPHKNPPHPPPPKRGSISACRRRIFTLSPLSRLPARQIEMRLGLFLKGKGS